MNENINLVEILKDVPSGIKLYSPVFGEVRFIGIASKCMIEIKCEENISYIFSKHGKYPPKYKDSECLLFPSKKQRDWDKFEYDPIEKETPCMVSNNNFSWILRYYAGNDEVFAGGLKKGSTLRYNHIIPVTEFDFDNKCRKK